MDQNSNEVVAPVVDTGSLKRPKTNIVFEKHIDFEQRKEELKKNYKPVSTNKLVSPDTDPVFVKKTWADKSLPVKFESTVRELFQNMNLENVVIVDVQCHGSLEKYVQIKTEQYGDESITTVSGAVYDQPLFATTPDGCIGIFPAPLSSLNYASGNYKNAGVGYFLNPDNREEIIKAIKTGNIEQLFQYIAIRELDPEYGTCGIGLPGCCPNYLLDFNPGVDSWAAFVVTSKANKRNLDSLMVEKDTRSRRVLVASPNEKMEASLLNTTYELFGETSDAITAENNFKRTVKQNEGKIYVSEFFEIIKSGFPGKTIICFFDVCSAFFPSIIGNVKNADTESIISFPIDQKLDKDKFNINDPSNTDPLNKDPDYIQLFQEYLTACAKFIPIKIPTIYTVIQFNGVNRPTFNIDYSPIVKIAFETTTNMFNVVKQSYKDCAVKDPLFRIGKMVQIQIDSELALASKLNDEGETTSDSQPQNVGYLSILKPNPADKPNPGDSVVVCKPRGAFANVTQFVRNLLFKRQLGCNSISKYTLESGEMDPIRDDDGPFAFRRLGFTSSASGGGGGPPFALPSLGLIPPPPGGGGPDVNSSAGPPFAFQGLGLNPSYPPPSSPSVFQGFMRAPPKTLSGKQGGLNPNAPKGGSRKTKKNKTRRTKTRKTKKNKRNNARKTKKTRR